MRAAATQAISVATHGSQAHLSAFVVEASAILLAAGVAARVVHWLAHSTGLDAEAARRGERVADAVADVVEATVNAAPAAARDLLQAQQQEHEREPRPAPLLHAYLTRPATTLVWATAAAAVVRAALRAASASWLGGAPVTLLGVDACAVLWGVWRLALIACVAWGAIVANSTALDRVAARHPRHAASYHALRDGMSRAIGLAALLSALSVAHVPLSAVLTFGGVGGVVLGVGAQAAASNALAGGFMMLSHAMHEGDVIELVGRGLSGTVTDFTLTSTTLLTKDATCVSLPNAELAKAPLRNYSRARATAIVADFPLPLSRLDDVGAAVGAMEAFLRGHPDVAANASNGRLRSGVTIGALQGGAITLTARAYVATPGRGADELERIRREVLLGLGRAITHGAGVPLALPTMSIVAAANGHANGAPIIGGSGAWSQRLQRVLAERGGGSAPAAGALQVAPPRLASSRLLQRRRRARMLNGRADGGDLPAAEMAAVSEGAAARAASAQETASVQWRDGEIVEGED